MFFVSFCIYLGEITILSKKIDDLVSWMQHSRVKNTTFSEANSTDVNKICEGLGLNRFEVRQIKGSKRKAEGEEAFSWQVKDAEGKDIGEDEVKNTPQAIAYFSKLLKSFLEVMD